VENERRESGIETEREREREREKEREREGERTHGLNRAVR